MALDTNLKERIYRCLDECLQTLSNCEPTVLYKTILTAKERLNLPMQLAVIGKISSSKSTLVNAILGEAEVVRTGQMEETFNVSWIKYGDACSDIKVFFKNGEVTEVPRSEWAKWASHQEKNKLKEQVKYIEFTYPSEILKEINIIDTPGLDAVSQVDSQNTIAFLKDVKPDAVVMLFTKSIAETTLSVLKDFQNIGSHDFNLSPLNALGVLAKVDTIWSAMNPDTDVIMEGARVIETTLYDKHPEVRKSLFSILPVSSLMGLCSSTITDDDICMLSKLSAVESNQLLEMLSSPDFFIDEDYVVGLTSEERAMLYDKYGLYGIYVLIRAIERNKDATIPFLSDVLRSKSGFAKFLFTVQSHFGERSTLIKSQNVLQEILMQISFCKLRETGEKHKAVMDVENIIVSTLLSLHEYKEWEYLSKYYNGKLDLDTPIAMEFVSICGESGYSAAERLRMNKGSSVEQLLNAATERALYWQKQYNIYSVIEPELGNFYKVLISSYNILLRDIKLACQSYNSAKAEMDKASAFLGFNEIVV